jgi:hypothetical protein
MAATLPDFSLTTDYFLFILSVTLTTLALLTLGGFARGMFKSHGRHTISQKLFFFPLFVVGIFAMGWFTGKIQELMLAYLKQNAASSITGLCIAVVIAWFLYDWVLWRRGS